MVLSGSSVAGGFRCRWFDVPCIPWSDDRPVFLVVSLVRVAIRESSVHVMPREDDAVSARSFSFYDDLLPVVVMMMMLMVVVVVVKNPPSHGPRRRNR